MNILILSQSAGAPKYGMVLRNYYWAKALTDLGHEVDVVASSFSHSRNKQPKSKLFVNTENIDGINYHWLWGAKHSGDNNLIRVLSMFLYGLYLYLPFSFLKKKYDIVVFSSPPPFSAYPAVRIAKKNKAKFIYDIRDLWPLTPMLLGGYTSKNPLIRLMAHAEKYATNEADIVTAVPKSADKYLNNKEYDIGYYMHVPNALTSDLLSVTEHPPELPDEIVNQIDLLKQSCDFLVVHPGAMGRANALDVLIKAVNQTNENIGLVLIGDGPHKAKLKQLTEQLKISSRVLFLDPIPKNYMQKFLSYMDAGYCGLLDSPLYEYGASPTKLNDYMVAELPIIYATKEDNNVVETSDCGVVCKPEDISDVANSITQLHQMTKEDRDIMGAKGKSWLAEYAVTDKQIKKILSLLEIS